MDTNLSTTTVKQDFLHHQIPPDKQDCNINKCKMGAENLKPDINKQTKTNWNLATILHFQDLQISFSSQKETHINIIFGGS